MWQSRPRLCILANLNFEATDAIVIALLCAILFCTSPNFAADFTYHDLQTLGSAEFLRLAGARWDAKDYRDSVTFGAIARDIRTQAFGDTDPTLAEIIKRIDAAMVMLHQESAAKTNHYLLMEGDELEATAKAGDPEAIHELALRYAYGLGGVGRDLVRAVGLFQVPAEKGKPESLFELGKGLLNLRLTQEVIASWGAKGPLETTIAPLALPSPVEFKSFNDAAKKGHPSANAFVALSLIDQGRDLTDAQSAQFGEQGWKSLRETARNGNDWAEYILANCLAKGFGISESRSLALTWARQAAAQGLPEGQALLAELTLPKVGDAGAQAQSAKEGWVALYCAAEQDYWLAYYPLGLRLVKGDGIAADRQAGKAWLEKAAAEGHMPAADALRKIR